MLFLFFIYFFLFAFLYSVYDLIINKYYAWLDNIKNYSIYIRSILVVTDRCSGGNISVYQEQSHPSSNPFLRIDSH